MKGSPEGTPGHQEIILRLVKILTTLKVFLTSILQLPPYEETNISSQVHSNKNFSVLETFRNAYFSLYIPGDG